MPALPCRVAGQILTTAEGRYRSAQLYRGYVAPLQCGRQALIEDHVADDLLGLTRVTEGSATPAGTQLSGGTNGGGKIPSLLAQELVTGIMVSIVPGVVSGMTANRCLAGAGDRPV
jgi:hypothetical protein